MVHVAGSKRNKFKDAKKNTQRNSSKEAKKTKERKLSPNTDRESSSSQKYDENNFLSALQERDLRLDRRLQELEQRLASLHQTAYGSTEQRHMAAQQYQTPVQYPGPVWQGQLYPSQMYPAWGRGQVPGSGVHPQGMNTAQPGMVPAPVLR